MTLSYVNVLFAHDDLQRVAKLTRPFAGWGWRVSQVKGQMPVILERLRAEHWDLFLVDLEIAERQDYALLKAWRSGQFLRSIPLVVTAWPDVALSRLARCVENGATDYINHPGVEVLFHARLTNILQRKLLEEQALVALEAFNEIEKIADDLRLVILPIGAMLSTETEYDRLIERIVEETRNLCNADAGIMFLAQDDGTLRYVYVRVESLHFTYHDRPDRAPDFKPVSLFDPDSGEPNHDCLPVYVTLGNEAVNLGLSTQSRFTMDSCLDYTTIEGYQAVSLLAVPMQSGQILGALVLINSQDPLTGEVVSFDEYHQQVAESLASQAAVVLHNRRLNEYQAGLLRYKRELEIGREIQMGFLPSTIPQPAGWEIAVGYYPAQEVAGDFYDIFQLPNGKLAFVIADIVGKGVTAALFMAIARSLFRAFFQQNFSLAASFAGQQDSTGLPPGDSGALLQTIRLTNSYFIANHADSYTFLTTVAGVLDPVSGKLLYVNAGHVLPVVRREAPGTGHSIEQLAPTGPAIGLMNEGNFRVAELMLQPGDMLVFYTDGLVESRNGSGEEYGLGRLLELLSESTGTLDELLTAGAAAVNDHTGRVEPFDDITLLAFRRLAPLPARSE